MSKKNIPYSKGTLKRSEKLRKTHLLKPIENEKLYNALAQAGVPVKSTGKKFVPQYHREVVYYGEQSDEEELLALNLSINQSRNVKKLKEHYTKDSKIQSTAAEKDLLIVKLPISEDDFDVEEFIAKWQSLLTKNEKMK